LTLQVRCVTPAAREETSSLAAGLGAPGPRSPTGCSWAVRPARRARRDRRAWPVFRWPLSTGWRGWASSLCVQVMALAPQRAAASLVKGHAVPRGKW